MLLLTMRTDKPEAEIGLYTEAGQISYEIWEAHKTLSETLHTRLFELLQSKNKHWDDLTGIVCYRGPGSFTGLRIGLTVANALAYSLNIPVTGQTGEDWITKGVAALTDDTANSLPIIPEYGEPAHTTEQKK